MRQKLRTILDTIVLDAKKRTIPRLSASLERCLLYNSALAHRGPVV